MLRIWRKESGSTNAESLRSLSRNQENTLGPKSKPESDFLGKAIEIHLDRTTTLSSAITELDFCWAVQNS
jgi:hypothetical protein